MEINSECRYGAIIILPLHSDSANGDRLDLPKYESLGLSGHFSITNKAKISFKTLATAVLKTLLDVLIT